MKEKEKRLENIIRSVVEGMGLKLWGIKFPKSSKGGTLRVYIDSEDGVTIDECAKVSRHLDVILDVEDPYTGPYILEVSSPGLDRPFFSIDQMKPYKGKKIYVELKLPVNNRKKFIGILKDFEGNNFCLYVEDLKEELFISWEDVEWANLRYE